MWIGGDKLTNQPIANALQALVSHHMNTINVNVSIKLRFTPSDGTRENVPRLCERTVLSTVSRIAHSQRVVLPVPPSHWNGQAVT